MFFGGYEFQGSNNFVVYRVEKKQLSCIFNFNRYLDILYDGNMISSHSQYKSYISFQPPNGLITKILLLTFNSLNDMVPIYLQELLLSYFPQRTLRSSSKSLLVIPRCNLRNFGQRAFWYIIHSIHITWNSLQVDMRRCRSLTTFKFILKTFLHKRIFSRCVAYF